MAARRSFSNDKAAVGEARRFVSEVLEDRHPDALVETAVLLTSEVVSNAVLHGRSAPTVVISLADDRVRVAVDDASPALPVRKHYGLEATTGRGLMLLETLADGWGAERVGSGKRVWFDLDSTTAARTTTTEQSTAARPAPVDLDDLAASFGELGDSTSGGPAARAGTATSASTSGRNSPRGGDHGRTHPRSRGPVRR